MTKILITFSILALTLSVSAQDKLHSKSIVLEKNKGIKTLTITTTENGKSNTEVFKNAEADEKIVEMEKRGNLRKTIVIGPDGSQRIEMSEG